MTFDPSRIQYGNDQPFQPMPVPIHPGIEAQKKTAEETEKIRKDTQEYVERLERELQQTRNELVEYKAEQSRKELENKLEQTEINKKNCRRSWLQVIIPLVLSPLITLLIEHFEDVIGYLRTFFHH